MKSKFFILDLGSGNTCQNDSKIIDRIYSELDEIDKDRKFILKYQLFKKAGNNIPLNRSIFHYAFIKGNNMGWDITASVFDYDSLQFLLGYDIPFVKIACRPELYWLAGEVPRKVPVIVSVNENVKPDMNLNLTTKLYCVSKYPAQIEDYDPAGIIVADGISDHTTSWALFEKYQPKFYECHFKLNDSTGPDAGPFARTPDDLRYIINYLGDEYK